MGWTISLLLLLLYYSLPLSALWLTDAKRYVRSLGKREIVVIFVLSGVFLAGVMALLVRERFVYYWDYASYWFRTIRSQDLLQSGVLDTLERIVSSINTEEYNNLAIEVIIIPLKFFGNSYYAFAILNVVMFYIPNAFMMTLTFRRIMEKYSLGEVKTVWVYGYVLLFSVALVPILQGYVDIIGMLPFTTIYLLVIDRDFERIEIAKDMCLGAAILWVLLLRRYFAYAVAGGAVFVIFYWLTYGSTRREPFYRLWNKVIDMLCSVIVPIIALASVFYDFFINSLFNDYSFTYLAYISTSFIGEWVMFARTFGMLFLVLMIAGILYGIQRKIGYLVVGLLLEIFISCSLFFGTVDMSWHQYYNVVFPMCLLIFLGICALLSICKKQAVLSWVARGLILFVVMGNFFLSIGIGTRFMGDLWGSHIYVPRVRGDLPALHSLESRLEQLSDEGYHTVYCTASSGIFNDEIIKNLNAPDFNSKINYAGTHHVDFRDGFSTVFFDADIIVACDPVQYHLPQGQEVIGKLNEVMLSDNIFSENYEIRGEYDLDGGVHVFVFVKQEPLEIQDIEYIRDIFEDVYPDYPELFSNRINDYLTYSYGWNLQEGLTGSIATTNRLFFSHFDAGENGYYTSQGEGHVIYGPYRPIREGVYDITFEYEYTGELEEGTVLGYVDACSGAGRVESWQAEAIAGENSVTLKNVKVHPGCEDFEARFYAYVEGITVRRIVLCYLGDEWRLRGGQTEKVVYTTNRLFGSHFDAGENGYYTSQGEGHVIYGPYRPMREGVYDITFEYEYAGELEEGTALGYVDAYSGSEKVNSGQAEAIAGENSVTLKNIKVLPGCDDFEARFYTYVEGVTVQRLVIHYLEDNWSLKEGQTEKVVETTNWLFGSYFDAGENGYYTSQGEGHVIYGPYRPMREGVYDITFEYEYTGELEEGTVLGYADAYSGSKKVNSGRAKAIAGENSVTLKNIKVLPGCDDFEARLYSYVEGVTMQRLVIHYLGSE